MSAVIQGWNPFSSTDFHIPRKSHELVRQIVRLQNGSDAAPFARMVDVWLLALALGARKANEHGGPIPAAGELVKITTLGVVKEPSVITFVALASLSGCGPVSEVQIRDAVSVSSASATIGRCDQLVALGLEQLLELTLGNAPTEIENLARGVVGLLGDEG